MPSPTLHLFRVVAALASLTALAGCAGRDHYFQPDARVGPVPSGAPDSALVTMGRQYAAHGGVFRFFFGDHYRALWALPVPLPLLNLARFPAAPQPASLSGGFQTTSVTMATASGPPLVARSIDKDPYKTLAKALRNTFLLRLVRDETCAANPFAPLALPPLAQAIGLLHTSPALYYVAATDSAFDALTPRLRGKVVLVEEKFDGAAATRHPQFGPAATDLKDTEVALAACYHSPRHQLDQLAFARARLFDVWIGDWDRHQGQWTWVQRDAPAPTGAYGGGRAGGPTTYVPVPKDRDQTFFRFDDGLLTWLASRRWAVRKLRTFHARYRDVPGLLRNARFLDARALNAVTAGQFDSIARQMQHQLPDSLLLRALHRWPAAAYALEGARTGALLRARRDALPEAARQVYADLAREPLVTATDEADVLTIAYHPDGAVTVSIHPEEYPQEHPETRSAGSPPARPPAYYHRTFRPAETRRVRIYALGGEDEVLITGRATRHTPRIDFYGGEGEDEVRFPAPTRARRLYVYDTKRGVEFPPDDAPTPGLRRKLTSRGDVTVHAFDREGL